MLIIDQSTSQPGIKPSNTSEFKNMIEKDKAHKDFKESYKKVNI